MRRVAAVLLLLTAAPSAFADAKPGDPIRIAVSPAAAPKPSLKYRLIPDRRDLTPGNAATLYYRAMASLWENQALLKEMHEAYWSEWLDTPVKDLPMDQMKEKLAQARNLLHEVGLAARCKDCDWQIEDRPEGFGLLLPEVQGFRSVGVVLADKARWQIAQGKWDDAIQTLQTGYAAARHMGRGPTFIHVLVGGAIARMMDQQVEALIQQPGAPNVYWALTDLPRPFLDAELALAQESRMLDRSIPWVKRLDGPPMSDAETAAAMDAMREGVDRITREFGLVQPSPLDKVGQAFFMVQAHGEAKRGLLARGLYTADQLEAMPEFQAVGLYTYLEYRDALDEVQKWVHAPHGLHHPGFQKSADKYGQAVSRLDRVFFGGRLGPVLRLGDDIVGYRTVYDVVGRTDRRLAALEYVEALRLYAEDKGQWPASPDDVTDVPLPDDPMTGKPFEYRVQENKATVSAPAITAGKADGPDAVVYEVFLRK